MSSENNRRRTPANTKKSAQPEQKEGQHSPFAGCSIIIAAALMMLFLVGFTIYSLFRMDDEISKFTETSPAATPVLDPTKFENEFNDLSRRMDGFRTAVLANEAGEEEAQNNPVEPVELLLSTRDLNLSIAAQPQFLDLRETFHILSLSPEEARIQISYRINGKPIGDTSPRYLNGIIHGKPRLESGQVLIDISHIDSNKGSVPDEFAAHLSDHQLTAPYLKDEKLGPVMKKLTSLQLIDDGIILRSDPAAEPPGQQEMTREEVERTKKIALVAFGSVLTIVSLLLVVFLRWKKKS
ncbi:hypothetical protein [Roseibacillus persicicus]|uniref:hypothetical protein n=1 Tax=Roseibacillus persicicus TaxID=454148 RepID=UPI00280CF9B4|nr:hypothetical protein [Roseibacillus persicicus]MDQ8190927.1 hypothetical protein [Roseibacillus persicicus]